MAKVDFWKCTKRVVADRNDASRKYRQVSRWITVKGDYVGPRHRFYDFGDRGNTEGNKRYLEYFTHAGRMYVLGQFMRFGYPSTYTIDLENGSCLVAYDGTLFYKPYLLEFIGEEGLVRLWEQVVEKGAEA